MRREWRSVEYFLHVWRIVQPNWIYGMCNLEGMAGTVIYDRLNKTSEGKHIFSGFLHNFEEDFFTQGE